MERQAIHTALASIFDVVSEANRYFAAQEPWALRKSDFSRMETVLFVTAEVLRQVGILVQPFMPGSAEKLLDVLAVPHDKRKFAHLAQEHKLAAGTALPAPGRLRRQGLASLLGRRHFPRPWLARPRRAPRRCLPFRVSVVRREVASRR